MGDFSLKTNTHELVTCLSEMKKEITRLQKGTGGLEDLQCKLEQSKIKQKYLHSMYMEEQSQRKLIESSFKEATLAKEDLKNQLETLKTLLSSETVKNKELENLLRKSENFSTTLKQKHSELEEKAKNLLEENKKIESFIKQLKDQDLKIESLEQEKAEQNKKIIKTLGENTKILQKGEKLQEQLIEKNKEIFELTKKAEQLFQEKSKNNEIQQENLNLSKKIMSLQNDLLIKEENYNESLNFLRKEIETLTKTIREKDIKIDSLKKDLQVSSLTLENLNTTRQLLEQKLKEQQMINKEIIESLTSELQLKASSMKRLMSPMKKPQVTEFQQTFDTFRKTD
jgi:chromosome segregation ATPase